MQFSTLLFTLLVLTFLALTSTSPAHALPIAYDKRCNFSRCGYVPWSEETAQQVKKREVENLDKKGCSFTSCGGNVNWVAEPVVKRDVEHLDKKGCTLTRCDGGGLTKAPETEEIKRDVEHLEKRCTFTNCNSPPPTAPQP